MTDRRTILAVVIFMGMIVLSLIASAVIIIVATDETVPDPLWSLGGVALGALSTLLVSTRSAPDAPAPVNVVNTPADPVNVEAVAPVGGMPAGLLNQPVNPGP